MADSANAPGFFRLVLALGLAGMVAGFLLVGIYLVTQPQIIRNRAEALQRAIFRVLPATKTVVPLVLEGTTMVPHEGATPDQLPEDRTIYECRDEAGRLVGYAIPAEGAGFQDVIKVLYGYDPARRLVVGMEVLENRETPGLGDKIITDAAFRKNFDALAIDPAIVTVKPMAKTAANEIEVISGATISSDAIARILHHSVRRWIEHLPVSSAETNPAPAARVGATNH